MLFSRDQKLSSQTSVMHFNVVFPGRDGGGSISSCQCFNFKSNFLKLGIATSIMKSFSEHFCSRLSVNCFYRRKVCAKLSAWSWINAIANQPSDWGTGPRILSVQLTKAMYRTLKKCNKKIITIIFNTSIVHFDIDIWSNAHTCTQQWDLYRTKVILIPTVCNYTIYSHLLRFLQTIQHG